MHLAARPSHYSAKQRGLHNQGVAGRSRAPGGEGSHARAPGWLPHMCRTWLRGSRAAARGGCRSHRMQPCRWGSSVGPPSRLGRAAAAADVADAAYAASGGGVRLQRRRQRQLPLLCLQRGLRRACGGRQGKRRMHGVTCMGCMSARWACCCLSPTVDHNYASRSTIGMQQVHAARGTQQQRVTGLCSSEHPTPGRGASNAGSLGGQHAACDAASDFKFQNRAVRVLPLHCSRTPGSCHIPTRCWALGSIESINSLQKIYWRSQMSARCNIASF